MARDMAKVRKPQAGPGKEILVLLGKVWLSEQKLWTSGRALGSRSEGCGFDPCPILDVSGVKAMPGSIPTPNSGSL